MVACLVLFFIGAKQHKKTSQSSPMITIFPQNPREVHDLSQYKNYCTYENIKGTVNFEGAAGNVYGTLIMTNTSDSTCLVKGDGFATINFSTEEAKNIKVINGKPSGEKEYSLDPGETLKAQIHYANGPQCSSLPRQVNISIEYTLSPLSSVTFSNRDGRNDFSIPACENPKEITYVDVTAFSKEAQ
jgi:hypothetical protein